MSYTQQKLLIATLACALLTSIQAVPTCERNDEDCRERHMHPDLGVKNGRSSYQTKVAGEDTNEYWLNQGKEFIKEKLQMPYNRKIAKNVIMFLGDGMGIATHSAARTLLGGEEKFLSFEKFPFTGLSRTYNVNEIVPDSASTGTAYLCGVKANGGTIGVDGHIERTDCQATLNATNYVHSIAKWALDAGKSAGVVTTTRVTHASPAGVYAHVAERDWENDSEVAADCGKDNKIEDIAYQLIHGEVGSKLSVVMGGGKAYFIDSNLYKKGKRSDGRNLIGEYKAMNRNNAYVETLDELNKLNLNKAERVLGLFQDSHLKYHLETDAKTNQPTLEEMTRKALEVLRRNDKGYFIFIEGGRIDMGHHNTYARLALDETVEFSKAVQAARELTSEEDTLIVVTADHSHAVSYSGYGNRGADILGRAPHMPNDNTPYMILSYANGPSFETFYDVKEHKRRDPTKFMKGEPRDQYPATLQLGSETHGGDDVAVFASGPWSHLFTGVYEQNAIPHMMGYATCIAKGLNACSD